MISCWLPTTKGPYSKHYHRCPVVMLDDKHVLKNVRYTSRRCHSYRWHDEGVPRLVQTGHIVGNANLFRKVPSSMLRVVLHVVMAFSFFSNGVHDKRTRMIHKAVMMWWAVWHLSDRTKKQCIVVVDMFSLWWKQSCRTTTSHSKPWYMHAFVVVDGSNSTIHNYLV